MVAFGVCTCTGGFYDNYATVQGIDTIIPVDVYIPGCPPRPESVIDGLMKLQDKIAVGRAAVLSRTARPHGRSDILARLRERFGAASSTTHDAPRRPHARSSPARRSLDVLRVLPGRRGAPASTC